MLNVEDISGAVERRRRDQDCRCGWEPPKFTDYIRAFGFGQPTGVDMPGESKGHSAATGELVGGLDPDRFSMGAGSRSQPIQLISAVSAIATEECFTSRMSLRM